MPNTPETFGRKQREQRRGTKQQRGYGGEWERISKIVRAAHPVCQICQNEPSAHVDHITPFKGVSDPLRTDRSNLQALCVACHQAKTRADQR